MERCCSRSRRPASRLTPAAKGCRFNHAVNEGHFAGFEIDTQFLVETPKSVQWSLALAHYHAAEAVKLAGVKKNLWSVTAKVSVTVPARCGGGSGGTEAR